MSNAKHHIPDGMTAVTPQLVVEDARALIDFAVQAFAARPGFVVPGSNGHGIAHGVFEIGGTTIFTSDAGGPIPPTTSNLVVYVPDVDDAFARALAAGAKVLAPVADMFWGDRLGMIQDAWGNVWQIATHNESVSCEEMEQRRKA